MRRRKGKHEVRTKNWTFVGQGFRRGGEGIKGGGVLLEFAIQSLGELFKGGDSWEWVGDDCFSTAFLSEHWRNCGNLAGVRRPVRGRGLSKALFSSSYEGLKDKRTVREDRTARGGGGAKGTRLSARTPRRRNGFCCRAKIVNEKSS